MIVSVTLPWPSDMLGQNSRENWRVKADETKAARYEARMLTIVTFQGHLPLVQGPLEATLSFYPPDKKRYDVFNLADRMKAAIDGIFDALGADDYLISSGITRRCTVVPRGMVIVEISRIGD